MIASFRRCYQVPGLASGGRKKCCADDPKRYSDKLASVRFKPQPLTAALTRSAMLFVLVTQGANLKGDLFPAPGTG
jgi:hypothetical protein